MSLVDSLITTGYFRYHIDDMGEQKEMEWGCHDYCCFFFLIFVLPFKNTFFSKFLGIKKCALLIVNYWSYFRLSPNSSSNSFCKHFFLKITKDEKKEQSLGNLYKGKWG